MSIHFVYKLFDAFQCQLFRIQLHFCISSFFVQFYFLIELFRKGGWEYKVSNDLVFDYEPITFLVQYFLKIGTLVFINEYLVSLIHCNHLESTEIDRSMTLLVYETINESSRSAYHNMTFIDGFIILTLITNPTQLTHHDFTFTHNIYSYIVDLATQCLSGCQYNHLWSHYSILFII